MLFFLLRLEGATVAQWSETPLPPPEVGSLNPGFCGKVGSFLVIVGSLQYRSLTNCMYWFPLPKELPVVMYSVLSDPK